MVKAANRGLNSLHLSFSPSSHHHTSVGAPAALLALRGSSTFASVVVITFTLTIISAASLLFIPPLPPPPPLPFRSWMTAASATLLPTSPFSPRTWTRWRSADPSTLMAPWWWASAGWRQRLGRRRQVSPPTALRLTFDLRALVSSSC